MMKKGMMKVVAILIVLSVVIYGAQILIFHDQATTFFYLFQDMAFMPITIAIATLVVGHFMDESSKKERIERTRILTCSFFSIVGNELRSLLETSFNENKKIDWNELIFADILRILELNRDSMLIISSNPNLLEHETFTELLWAVFHLREELIYRTEPTKQDKAHLVLDAQRVYDLLLENWMDYSEYIKEEYPYFHQSAINQKWVKQQEAQLETEDKKRSIDIIF